MRAYIERKPWEDRVSLRLATNAGYDTIAATGIDDDGNIVWEKFPTGGTVPPFLTLTPEAMKAITDAAQGAFPPSDATTRHLDDAIAVRDRLFTYVEKLARV